MHRYLFLFALIGLLTACKTGVATPDVGEFASPEAVALSLSTVDSEESLPLFEYDRAAPLGIQEDRRWRDGNATGHAAEIRSHAQGYPVQSPSFST